MSAITLDLSWYSLVHVLSKTANSCTFPTWPTERWVWLVDCISRLQQLCSISLQRSWFVLAGALWQLWSAASNPFHQLVQLFHFSSIWAIYRPNRDVILHWPCRFCFHKLSECFLPSLTPATISVSRQLSTSACQKGFVFSGLVASIPISLVLLTLMSVSIRLFHHMSVADELLACRVTRRPA